MKKFESNTKSFIKLEEGPVEEHQKRTNFWLYLPRKRDLSLLSRPLTTILLISALLMPLVIFGQTPRISDQTAPGIVTPAPIAAAPPPAAFVVNYSNTLLNDALSTVAEIGGLVANRYQLIVDSLQPPKLPEGFAMAKVPTNWERFSTSISSITSYITPLLFVSPNSKFNNAEPSSPVSPLLIATGTTRFDFDHDGKADAARWQTTGEWKIKNSSDGSFTTLNLGAGTAAAPADYDGDGYTDRAVFTDWAGTWKIRKSTTNLDTNISFGQSGDKVVSGDYDGDGKADVAIWRPSNGTWYVWQSYSQQVSSVQFGASGDIPVPGNYDGGTNGDNKMDYAVFRPSTGTWYVLSSASGYSLTSFQWGVGSDIAIPADYDGDGKTDFAVYRPSNGTWYVNRSDGNPYIAKTWGNYGDQPVPTDYDGDGKDDFAVWRPTTGVWYIVKSTDSTLNTYAYEQLGIANDVAVPSAYLKQIGGQVLAYNLANARLSPKNGTGGTDLYSRNFSWGTGLVSLPGRAGLDAGFGVSYNSLVWTKEPTSNTMVFDADQANISPGFRFGFPTIEPSYYNGLTQQFSYLMVTPSGGRVEFRQNAASGIYETADSSYTQLTVNTPTQGVTATESVTLTVRTTDGTQMSYNWRAGAYRLAEIKDRNGNFITVNYDAQYGLLRTVTDTLGRVINVNYDAEFYPTSITQQWRTNNGDSTGSDVTHTYATFSYGSQPISPEFNSSVGVYGPSGGAYVKVLNQITYADGTSTTFWYNSYGQVWKIRNVAADSSAHELSSVRTDLQTPPSEQTDCPRFTTTYNKVEKFNNDQETVIHNTLTSNGTFSAGGETLSPVDIVEVYMDNAPYNVHSKTYYYTAGNWQEGLPFGTEDIADGVRQRWTRTVWAHDSATTLYKVNPRVTETKVGDAANTKRTTVEYLLQPNTNASIYGLISTVRVYDSNQTTVLKKVATEYNRATAYESRRIIGLPSKTELYEGESQLMSQVTYLYDGGDLSETNQSIAPIQHDNANYSSVFNTGRGNLTSTTRHEVPSNATESTSTIKYNTAGAPVSQSDPSGRTVNISYAESFNDDNNSRNTYAYPTTLIDPAGYSSQIKYRYDTGANVWAKSPDPNATYSGKTSTRTYDDKGRLEKEAIVGAGYTRYEYPMIGIQSKVYSTVTDLLNDGADATDEILTETWTDGVGRIRRTRTEHPNSTGGWSGILTEYDILGRVTRSTVPTEVSVSNPNNPDSWSPTGDDNRGIYNNQAIWLWTAKKYDWKGRVVREIKTDGTDSPTPNASDILISYDGCGCAGGQVTTVKGEEIIEKDWQGNNPVSLGRRTQKIYADILGRTKKIEIMNWDGVTPYATTVNVYNGRDQVTSSTKYAGAENNSTSQTITFTYDGHGRLKTRHLPQQNTGTATTYNYNADDSISSTVDARDASTNYTYNSRGLVEQISYGVPANSTIAAAPTVSFAYDPLGNRKKMTDGLGEVNYTYNGLSQMTSETRTFTDNSTAPPLSLPNAPEGNNSFKLTYEYTLSGELKSLQDPYNQKINYGYDKAGRLQQVGGATAFNGITTYASNPHYRAWGGLQSLDYGNGTQMQMTFNNRLQADHYELNNTNGAIMNKNYEYYADGSLRKLDDLYSYGANADKFDRLTTYDQVGRVKEGKSGLEAHGGTVAQVDMKFALPYRQSYTYNAFDNLTARTNLSWGVSYLNGRDFDFTRTYQNDRVTNAGWQYDADGRLLIDDDTSVAYNAAGQLTTYQTDDSETSAVRKYDGDGRDAMRVQTNITWDENVSITETKIKYYIRSSILGGEAISQADETGRKATTNVYAAGTLLAVQNLYHDATNNTDWETLRFEQQDASGLSYRTTITTGSAIMGEGSEGSPAELDPLGGNVGLVTHFFNFIRTPGQYQGQNPIYTGDEHHVTPFEPTFYLDGLEISRERAMRALSSGAASVDYAHSDSFALGNLGIMPIYGYRSTDRHHDDPNDNVIRVHIDEERYIVGYTISSWNLPQQNEQGGLKGLLDFLKQVLNQYRCDTRLARIFGGERAVMATLVQPRMPSMPGSQLMVGPFLREGTRGESPSQGVAHLYASKDGTGNADDYAFTPPGYSKTEGSPSFSNDDQREPQNFRRFYYKPGSLSQYGYDGGLIVNFTHIGPADANRNPPPPNPNNRNNAGSIQAGVIGGTGGTQVGGTGGWVHSHMIFNSWDGRTSSAPSATTRIDPRSVFCKDLGF